MRGRIRCGAALGALAIALLGLPSGASAAAGPAASVTMNSESGDWVGAGQVRTFHPGNADISVSGDLGYLTVSVSGGTLGDYFSFDFAAPPGQTLHPGVGIPAGHTLTLFSQNQTGTATVYGYLVPAASLPSSGPASAAPAIGSARSPTTTR